MGLSLLRAFVGWRTRRGLEEGRTSLVGFVIRKSLSGCYVYQIEIFCQL
jgi:hypothetical protein